MYNVFERISTQTGIRGNRKDSCIFTLKYCHNFIRDKVFKNEPSKTCGRQPLKFFEVIWFDEADHITSNVLKAV